MKKQLYLIIFGVILFGIGVIVTVYELNRYNISTKVPIKDIEKITYSVENNYKYVVDCNNCVIKYKTNDELENILEIKIEYPSDYYSYKIEDGMRKNIKYIDIIGGEIKREDIFNLIVRDLKHKDIRNYFEYFNMKVTVSTSRDNMKRVIKNED